MARSLIVVLLLALGSAMGAAPARSQTVQSTVDALLHEARDSGFFEAQPVMADSLQRCALWFARSGAGRLSAEQLVRMTAAPRPSWTDRLRWNQPRFEVDGEVLEVAPQTLDRYTNAVLEIVNTPGGLHDHFDERLGSPRRIEVLEPTMQLYGRLLEASREESFEVLRRYERKFGPGSVRLNFVETLLNLGAARVPGFGPDERGYPGAWELVAAYSSAYLGWDDDREEVTLVSLLEVGLRHYNFGESWGSGRRLSGALRPATFALGAAMAGEPDGPMIWPWRGEQRWGAFFAWGEYKVAALFGDEDGRFLFTKQFQLLPGLF